MDKENIKKLIIKFRSKLMPLAMALILTLGALLPVASADAKEVPIYAKKLNIGENFLCGLDYDYGNSVNNYGLRSAYNYQLVESSADVFTVFVEGKDNNHRDYFQFFISTSPFKIMRSNYWNDIYLDTLLDNNGKTLEERISSLSTKELSLYIDGGSSLGDYYFGMIDVNTSNATYDISIIQSFNFSGITFEIPDSLPIIERKNQNTILSLFDYLYSNNMQIGTETIETNYAGSSTAEILPPQNVSFYNDKTYNTEDSFTQIQWTCPNDDTLKMEIACEVYWREGVLRKKNYDTYSWKTYDNSDIPGTYHKYSFRQNQPCLDYFSENGIEVPKFYNVTYWYLRWARCDDSGNVTYSLWTKLDPKFDYIPEYVEDGIILDSIEGNTTLFGKDIGDNSTWAETGEFDVDSGSWVPKHVYVDSNGDSVIMSGSEKAPATSPGLDSSGNNLAPSHNELTDIIPENFGDVFNSFNDYLESAWDFLGDFPSYLGDIMTFLPSGITVMLGLGIVMAIMLRLLGR